MFPIVLTGFICLIVGWATPQPAWAATLTEKVVAKFKELKDKGNDTSV